MKSKLAISSFVISIMIFLIYSCFWLQNSPFNPANWPIIGMLWGLAFLGVGIFILLSITGIILSIISLVVIRKNKGLTGLPFAILGLIINLVNIPYIIITLMSIVKL